MHTYRVTLRGGRQVVGNEAYITRRFGSEVWEYYGEVVDRNVWCRHCMRNNTVVLPPDPWGDPSKIVSPF